jgi:hypothetical protein
MERRGAMAMLGFAQRFRPTRRSQDWMEELREARSGRIDLSDEQADSGNERIDRSTASLDQPNEPAETASEPFRSPDELLAGSNE